MTLETVRLGKVADYIRGITFKPADVVPPHSPESVVCMTTKNVQEALDESKLTAVSPRFVKRKEQYLQAGDILVSCANSWNLVGKVSFVPELPYIAAAGGFISILRACRDRIDPRYLYHWMASGETQHRARLCARQTTNIANLDRERFLQLEVPLPPLPEQRRIAAILDKADAVRRKRQQTVDLADQFLRSAFLDMFGDPVTNPKGWPVRKLCDVLNNIEGGWSPKCKSRPAEADEWGVLKLGAVSSGTYNPQENKAMESATKPRGELEVRNGDLLFTRKNTYELVGASAYVFETRPHLTLPDLVFRLGLTKEVDSIYVWAALSHPATRAHLRRMASGSSGSMPNISKARLRELLLPLPPVEHQVRLRNIAIQSRAAFERIHRWTSVAEELRDSLVQRAFREEV